MFLFSIVSDQITQNTTHTCYTIICGASIIHTPILYTYYTGVYVNIRGVCMCMCGLTHGVDSFVNCAERAV